ncbi:TetR/AcrR family transcriptional regulator [Kitasatospora acidiphila]|uniref:TetR/AcrR family transcriptional regulator n=1 Tax=Kitasatospora acidiphila TaxID=2567942 RepID=A0A540W1Y1_9ACTN|nr:helix-turn-helix domain-containing protein [Kitasatospora acidiphila]TQF02334.1 TetR/AcrR family transcriptional regulator [Kitasatospora acidiphila]
MARTTGRSDTREKLLHAAEQLFATQGVDGAQTRDIVRLAGQANPSAVQYHFGSRAGLLDEIMKARQERTERVLAQRLPELAGLALPELLRALIDAEATELRTADGRHALRISAQLGHQGGPSGGSPGEPSGGSSAVLPASLGQQRFVDHITERLAVPPGVAGLPEPVRRQRLELALTLIRTALADRARQYTDGEQPLTDEAFFLADLASMATALLQAPLPAP